MNIFTRTLTITTLGLAVTIGGLGTAHAAVNDVCSALSTGKIDTPAGPTTVTVTAPAGLLVSGYCVKAGSENVGNGPVYVAVEPAQASVTFGYPGGKDISHYSATFVDAPVPSIPVPEIPEVPTIPEIPEETTTTAATTVVTEETTTTAAAQEQPVPTPEPTPTPTPTNVEQVVSEGPVPSPAVLSASADQLPTTGSQSTATLIFGAGAVALGLALVRFTRRSTTA